MEVLGCCGRLRFSNSCMRGRAGTDLPGFCPAVYPRSTALRRRTSDCLSWTSTHRSPIEQAGTLDAHFSSRHLQAPCPRRQSGPCGDSSRDRKRYSRIVVNPFLEAPATSCFAQSPKYLSDHSGYPADSLMDDTARVTCRTNPAADGAYGKRHLAALGTCKLALGRTV